MCKLTTRLAGVNGSFTSTYKKFSLETRAWLSKDKQSKEREGIKKPHLLYKA